MKQAIARRRQHDVTERYPDTHQSANPVRVEYNGSVHADIAAIERLSPREIEIARLVSRGLPNKAIARVLDLSPWTISAHLKRIFAKVGISSRTELAVIVVGAVEEPLPGAAPRDPADKHG
ncbi:MAG: LuxR family transcriptional regulator [Rhodospirillales bacterium]|nr:MAG: LuxR family transcriptional regulator [Rhodospirillales bacterium]